MWHFNVFLDAGYNKDAVYAAAEYMRKEEVFVLQYGAYAIATLYIGAALQAFSFMDLGISTLGCLYYLWGTYILYDSASEVFSMFIQDDNDEANISNKEGKHKWIYLFITCSWPSK